ncbi:hypothetical protein IKE84_01985 [Candidatus Saccharibacteria bacterium]|nr:hypothetical protein [Candidatus Saccharibacteria bacterium]
MTSISETYLKFSPELFGPEMLQNPGTEYYSSAEKIGELLRETFKQDAHFYLFSPDETTSNKLEKSYEATKRAWALPIKSWDMPEAENGRIVELLSENALLAAMIGHVLEGEKAMMTSYEAFFSIVTSQLLQYIKFLVQSEDVPWRKAVPALNLLSTSTCWRQDHNGFSHQSPMLISTLLSNPSNKANCIFPVDDVAAAAAYDFMLNSENVVNLTTFNKTDEPRWIDRYHATYQFDHGASIFGFASDDDPDYVFTAAGDIATREAIRAIEILRQDIPGRRFRFVGINALSYGAIGTTNAKLSRELFNSFYTDNRPIIANFHGYPETLRTILTNYAESDRIRVHGFEEHGSTTTPFEMLRLNHASRYDLAMDVAAHENRDDLVAKYSSIINENAEYARKFGKDQINVL